MPDVRQHTAWAVGVSVANRRVGGVLPSNPFHDRTELRLIFVLLLFVTIQRRLMMFF
jgi:hypothetical protein